MGIHIPERDTEGNIINSTSLPFATSKGHSFKGRGIKKLCPTGVTTTLSYQLAETHKLTGVELLNAKLGDEIHMKILDDGSGTYSTIPNYQLDEFGINWNVRPDVFIKDLPYSAKVHPGMIIAFDYTNNDTVDKMIYINLDLHKVV